MPTVSVSELYLDRQSIWLDLPSLLLDGNHSHLLTEVPKANLRIGMRQLNGIYTESFSRRHNRVRH